MGLFAKCLQHVVVRGFISVVATSVQKLLVYQGVYGSASVTQNILLKLKKKLWFFFAQWGESPL